MSDRKSEMQKKRVVGVESTKGPQLLDGKSGMQKRVARCKANRTVVEDGSRKDRQHG